jgi:transposase
MAISTPNQFPVRLSEGQRQRLLDLTRNGRAPAKKIRHAQVLLLSDRGRPDGARSRTEIARALGLHVNSVDRIRKRFVQEGEAPALERKPRLTPPVPPKLDGRAQAHIVAICCGAAPQGHARWTLRLIADELVKRKFVTSVCIESVRQVLKKTSCGPGASSRGASRSATRPAS